VDRIFDDVMIDSPDDIKRNKRKENNKLKKSFALEYAERKNKEYANSHKQQVVKWMFLNFFFDVFKEFHVLENRAINNNECSNHHKSDKQDMNEIFTFNMNEIEL